MNIKKSVILLLLVMGTCCWVLQAADSEFPLVQSMSYFPYSAHHTLAKNQYCLSLDLLYSNIFVFTYDWTSFNDMEMLGSTLGFRYGLSDKITFEMYSRLSFCFEGFMDGMIMDFHKLLGLPEGGRTEFPKNVVNYRYKDAFSYSEGSVTPLPLVLGVLGHLYSKGDFCVNGRLTLGIPLSSKPGFSSGKPFYTAGIILLYKKKNISVDFSNHLSLFKNPNWLGDENLANLMYHSHIRVDYKRLFGGLMYRSSPFRDNELANDAYQLYIGYKIWKYIEFSFVEEFPPQDTVPDVSFRVKIDLKGIL